MRLNAAPQEENAYRDQPRLHGHDVTLTEKQMVGGILKDYETGVPTGGVVSRTWYQSTDYRWNWEYGGMNVSEAQRLSSNRW